MGLKEYDVYKSWVHCHHEEEILKENDKIIQDKKWVSDHIHGQSYVHSKKTNEEVTTKKEYGCNACHNGKYEIFYLDPTTITRYDTQSKYCPECGRKLTT
ncbi:hypothetical protein KKG36_01175 [Patescibacteria group bacterium]|nr:hypothetical protein [Patescibacteria group bacterium]